MKQRVLGKEKWIEICQDFKSRKPGDMKTDDFLREVGVSKSTFYKWRLRLEKEDLLEPNDNRFVEVVKKEDLSSQAPHVVIRFGKVEVTFIDSVPPPSWIAQLALQC
jgi:hypothetical protein